MIKNGAYQIEIVNKLAFVREAGTAEEYRAAKMIQDEIAALGGSSVIEPFKVPHYDVKKAELRVTAPVPMEFPVGAIGFTGSTPEEGIEAELLYAENGSDMKLKQAAGKILLFNGPVAYEQWEKIVKSGALGYIMTYGEPYDDMENTNVPCSHIRKNLFNKGRIPGVGIRCRDAIEMLKAGAERVKITVLQEEGEADSGNVVAQLKGTRDSDDYIALSAHYDSVPFSPGAWDNASGCADLLALYAYFVENPPPVSMHFIWCSAEEIGRLGSQAYVKQHKAEIENCRMNLNLDMTGVRMGHFETNITGEESFLHMAECFAREIGLDTVFKHGIRTSDSAAFADAGIPTIDFCRRGKAEIHTPNDILYPLSADIFAQLQTVMRQFLCRVMGGVEFLIPRVMPPDLQEALAKHFGRIPQ